MKLTSSFMTGILILGSLVAAGLSAQGLQLNSGKNIMDDTAWARISITSSTFISPPAVLQLECTQKKKHHSIHLFLVSGNLESHPHDGLVGPISEWLLRMKLDGGAAVWRSWRPTEQTGIYEYEGQGVTGMGAWYYPFRLLKDLLSAKTLYIEFQRYGERDVYVANFDLSQLKTTFDARPECQAK
jgi:hypothetical protein